MNYRLSLNPPKKSRSPSPDSPCVPDNLPKSPLFQTLSPTMSNATSPRTNLDTQRDSYISLLESSNKELKQQNIKLRQKIKAQSQSLDLIQYGNSDRGLGDSRSVEWGKLEEGQKDIVLGEFNRMLREVRDKASIRIKELEQRVAFSEKAYQKLTHLASEVKKSRNKERERKRGLLTSRNNGYIRDHSMVEPNVEYSIIVHEEMSSHSEVLKELEEELTNVRKENRELALELKEVYMRTSRKQGGKQGLEPFQHEHYERELLRLRELVEELRFKLNDREEMNCVSTKEFKGFKLDFGAGGKAGEADKSRVKQRDAREIREREELISELEQEKESKNQSERAMELILHNYKISQESLEFIKAENEKLKSVNMRMNQELQESMKSSRRERQGTLDSNLTSSMNRCSEDNRLPSPAPSPSQKTSKSPPSSFDPFNSHLSDKIKTKLNHLKYQNQGLHLLRKKYHVETNELFQDLKVLEGIVCRYWETVVRESGARMEKGRKEMEVIQGIIESLLEKLVGINKELDEGNGYEIVEEEEIGGM